MAGWNIEFHDPNPSAQKEGDFMLGAFKAVSGFQLACFREAWGLGGSDNQKQPDMFDNMINFAMGDDIYKK